MNVNYISLIDLFIITIIMFGPQIIGSIGACNVNGEGETEEFIDTAFSIKENLYAILTQIIQLLFVFIYIHFRNINSIDMVFNVSIRNIAYSVLIFCLTGLAMDMAQSFKSGFSWIKDILKNNIPVSDAVRDVNLSLIVISLINGFYEEFFFLFICMSVNPLYSAFALVYSLVIRIVIHLYQEKFTALTLGLNLGITYLLIYKKITQDIFVFSFAHTLADIAGLSLINLL